MFARVAFVFPCGSGRPQTVLPRPSTGSGSEGFRICIPARSLSFSLFSVTNASCNPSICFLSCSTSPVSSCFIFPTLACASINLAPLKWPASRGGLLRKSPTPAPVSSDARLACCKCLPDGTPVIFSTMEICGFCAFFELLGLMLAIIDMTPEAARLPRDSKAPSSSLRLRAESTGWLGDLYTGVSTSNKSSSSSRAFFFWPIFATQMRTRYLVDVSSVFPLDVTT
mmetsp:Transcript_31624/g.87272  ORF Transcript_31624/g.87272 Transcript_31624/m.87272 type:complete len:226 (+) Transcript_31624:937-1614(+)